MADTRWVLTMYAPYNTSPEDQVKCCRQAAEKAGIKILRQAGDDMLLVEGPENIEELIGPSRESSVLVFRARA